MYIKNPFQSERACLFSCLHGAASFAMFQEAGMITESGAGIVVTQPSRRDRDKAVAYLGVNTRNVNGYKYDVHRTGFQIQAELIAYVARRNKLPSSVVTHYPTAASSDAICRPGGIIRKRENVVVGVVSNDGRYDEAIAYTVAGVLIDIARQAGEQLWHLTDGGRSLMDISARQIDEAYDAIGLPPLPTLREVAHGIENGRNPLETLATIKAAA